MYADLHWGHVNPWPTVRHAKYLWVGAWIMTACPTTRKHYAGYARRVGKGPPRYAKKKNP
jgi:hypothetical protein